MTADAPRIPDAGPLPSVALGHVADERLANGLRLIAVRRSQVPLAQVRLRVPLGEVRAGDGAAIRILPKSLLAGAGGRSGSELAAWIQRIGGTIDAWADVDYLSLVASAPAGRLAELLVLLADVVARPMFRRAETAGERDRAVQAVLIEAADPTAVATRGLRAALFPHHPYANPLPSVSAVRRTGPGTLRGFHEAHVRPSDGTLVVVGDVDPRDAARIARDTLGSWSFGHESDGVRRVVEPRAPGARGGIRVLHRPGAVQANVRVGARCAGRHDEGFPALLLATTVLGGFFSSRLMSNLRERNGFTYGVRAGVEEHRRAAAFVVQTEVATEVAAMALTELRYELARIATAPVAIEELESARRYAIGTLAMACATQAQLADALADTVASDLDPSYLESLVRALATLDVGAVAHASHALGPVGMTTVVVGDADAIADSLATLDDVEVVRS